MSRESQKRLINSLSARRRTVWNKFADTREFGRSETRLRNHPTTASVHKDSG